jgi:hypothetical protein
MAESEQKLVSVAKIFQNLANLRSFGVSPLRVDFLVSEFG